MANNLIAQYLEENISVEDADLEVNDLEVQAVLAEVEEGNDEVVDIEKDIEEMEAVEAGLESIAAGLEVSMKEGGLVPQAAVGYDLAISAWAGRVGLESAVPSLEEFDSQTGREAATQVSMEGVKDTLKRIWNAIKAAVSKAVEAAKNFFAKVFGGVEKVEKKLKAVKKAIATAKKDGHEVTDADKKIAVPYAETLRFNGKTDIKSILEGMKKFADAGKDYGNYNKRAKEYFEVMAASIEDAQKAESKEGAEEALDALAKGAEIEGIVDTTEKNLISGDKVITVNMTGDEKKASVAAVQLATAKVARALDGKQEHKAISFDEMDKVIDGAMDVLVFIKKEQKSVDALGKVRESAMKAAGKAVEKSEEGISKHIEKAKQQVLLRKVQFDGTRLARQISAHAFSVARASVAYVEANLDAYSKPKAEDK